MKKVIIGAAVAAILTTGCFATDLKGEFFLVKNVKVFQLESFNELKKTPEWLNYFDLRHKDETRECVKSTKYIGQFLNIKISNNIELADIIKKFTTDTKVINFSGKMTLIARFYKKKEDTNILKFWTDKKTCDFFVDNHNRELRKKK